ncbi:hypothetical protein HNP69_000531 [Chryseobacterium koreense]|nr:hypothetical protein [Chryseobacterium koreense]
MPPNSFSKTVKIYSMGITKPLESNMLREKIIPKKSLFLQLKKFKENVVIRTGNHPT